MKLIDLLVKIANGEEVPEKIKYNNCEYKFNKDRNDYECAKIKDWSLFYNKIGKANNMIDCLNDEIEILEDKPKKIKKIKFPENWNEHRNMTFEEFRKAYKINFEISANTINEIIDNLNYLLERSDKE